MSAILKDFDTATTLDFIDSQEIKFGRLYLYKRAGFMRFGKQYVFGWKGAVPIQYEDIQRIYEYNRHRSSIYATGTDPLPRNRVYISTPEGEQFIGIIPSGSLHLYVSEMLDKNPNIQHCIIESRRFGRNARYIPYDEYWKNVQEKAERKHRSIEHWKSGLKKTCRKS